MTFIPPPHLLLGCPRTVTSVGHIFSGLERRNHGQLPVSVLSARWFVGSVPGMEEKGRNTFVETSASSAGG